MISKAFQNIVTQMADVFPKKFGIVDSHGLVLANNGGEPTGDIIENLVYAATNNDKLLFKDGYTSSFNVKQTVCRICGIC